MAATRANDDGGAPATAPAAAPNRRGIAAWCFYDWANSAFTTIVITFVFATYFASAVAEDKTLGAAQWGFAISASGLAIAFLAPVLGAIADRGGRRKPWIFFFTVFSVLLTAALWFIAPDPAYVVPALILVALANVGFEMGIVFYNAMLPDIAPSKMIGRVSGWAWGLGYVGGLACLVVILTAFDTGSLDQVRLTSVLVAVWFGLFSLPLFLWTPDTPGRATSWRRAIGEGLGQLLSSLRQIRRHGDIARFLLARLFYNDGLVTLFAVGGIYAKVTFGMSTAEVLQFGVAINVTAGLGAAAFAWIDDRIGPKRTILISLVGLIAFGAAVLTAETTTMFLVWGSALGIFVGPVQAASRSMMAHLAPKGLETEMFGLFAFSGKATAFVGPFVFGAVTAVTASQRWGMATILVFFALGAALLLFVADARR
ncbi:MAG: MFS transporter [Rhodospirillales bacterium]|jgi:UMF1 family MFS transporter|nr:MFS transporter [Rhodospirillales bacterium]MDP6644913.1 MFS transporter [Rhodospirillales bacterium]MDP6841375.1 MFS transporter [Rhodospirillales bacterium]